MSGAIKAYDSRLHQSNQGPRVHPSLREQRWDGAAMPRTVLLYLTLRWASQPKDGCKVRYHRAEPASSLVLSRERFTAGIWSEKWSKTRKEWEQQCGAFYFGLQDEVTQILNVLSENENVYCLRRISVSKMFVQPMVQIPKGHKLLLQWINKTIVPMKEVETSECLTFLHILYCTY